MNKQGYGSNTLPSDKILDLSKWKAFADDWLDVVKIMEFASKKVENNVGQIVFVKHEPLKRSFFEKCNLYIWPWPLQMTLTLVPADTYWWDMPSYLIWAL